MNALTSRPAHRARRSVILATLALPLAVFAVPAVAVAAPVASALTLTASPAVVDWGRNAVIAVHLAVPPGSSVSVGNRVVHIQFSPTSGPAGFAHDPVGRRSHDKRLWQRHTRVQPCRQPLVSGGVRRQR